MSGDDILLGLIGLIGAAAVPLLIGWLVTAFIGAHVASARGRNSGTWFMMTLVFGPLAILLLALFPVDQEAIAAHRVRRNYMKWCPFCHRAIAPSAIKCCYCHTVLAPLAYCHRQLVLREDEEEKTARGEIRKMESEAEYPRTSLDTISKAVHLCGKGVSPERIAEQLEVSEQNIRSWLSRYMEDDDWMQRVDMSSNKGSRSRSERRAQRRVEENTGMKGITKK